MWQRAVIPITVVPARVGFPALRISRWVMGQLAERTTLGAVIDSVYGRVANLRLDSGGLLSLSAPEVALAPNGMAVKLPPGLTMRAIGIRSAQPATLSRVGLHFPDARLEVTFAGAAAWEPRPRVSRVAPSELAHRLLAARATAIGEGATDSLLPLLWTLESDGSADLNGLARTACGPADLLGVAAATYDGDAVIEAASRLAGLGPGLTPSGDDFLAGFAAAWALVGEAIGLPPRSHARVSMALVAGASTGASGLGRAWIEHAARGGVSEPMGRLFTALFASEPGKLTPAVRGALALGATSGTDSVVGALRGAGAALVAADRDRSWC